MTWYVGLTNDPNQRRVEHGNPPDWHVTGPFPNERAAREWERQQLLRSDCRGGQGGRGWQYGYWYTIANRTRQ